MTSNANESNHQTPVAVSVSNFDEIFGPTIERCLQHAAVGAGVDRIGFRLESPQPHGGTFGALIFSTGMRVVLDRSVVLGRDPKSPVTASEGDVRLVRLDYRTISRQHAAIRLHRWQAILSDLGSKNGTFATAPGEHRRRVEVGNVVAIRFGTTVDLGDNCSFVVEVLAGSVRS